MSEKTFLRITNRDIIEEIKVLGEKLVNIEKHLIRTNGKVMLNRWISSTALGLCFIIIGIIYKLS